MIWQEVFVSSPSPIIVVSSVSRYVQRNWQFLPQWQFGAPFTSLFNLKEARALSFFIKLCENCVCHMKCHTIGGLLCQCWSAPNNVHVSGVARQSMSGAGAGAMRGEDPAQTSSWRSERRTRAASGPATQWCWTLGAPVTGSGQRTLSAAATGEASDGEWVWVWVWCVQDKVQCEGGTAAQGPGVLSWQRQHLDQVTIRHCHLIGEHSVYQVLDRGEQWSFYGVCVQRQEYPQVGFTVRTLSDKVLTVILERVTWVRQEVRRMAALLSRKLITELFMLTNIRLIKSTVNPEHVADLFFAGLWHFLAQTSRESFQWQGSARD